MDPHSELERLYGTLHEYLQLEAKFQPRLCLPAHPENGEVSVGARDGAAHVMRCLKMWFDLPSAVLLHAVNLLDRFLTKMKVRPCHVPCISVSCVNISVAEHGLSVPIDELVSISQCGCTVGDVARMSAVVREKLSLADTRSLTALDWLVLLKHLVGWAERAGYLLIHQSVDGERVLTSQLEMVACDATCSNLRAPEIALVLLFDQLESNAMEAIRRGEATDEHLQQLRDCFVELSRVVIASDASLQRCRTVARAALERCSARAPHRQRLCWRLSSRTLKVLRPTDRFLSNLPTIEEQNLVADQTSPRPRSGSESSDDLSEESADWPRSPVLPVYCE